MDLGIEGRVAMVAASSRGLGRAIAASLAREGCRVSICGRGTQDLEKARAWIQEEAGREGVFAHPCDVALEGDLEAWYRETRKALGPVDILVTSTGGPAPSDFQHLTDAQWAAGVQSTLMNAVRLSRLVLPEMRARKWGRILHLTSLVAKQPLPMLTISSTLRAGLSALTRTMAVEFAPEGILVNALLPGHVLTDRQVELAHVRAEREGLTLEASLAKAEAIIPLGRFGRPEEIGDVAAFLCSERAGYLTGASLQVDGGLVSSTF
jgi:3-oxoacyl-[acyl-carrier protein] reductase